MTKNITITPGKLSGKITVPASKSISHRALICAALAEGRSEIKNLLDCADTRATINILNAFGCRRRLLRKWLNSKIFDTRSCRLGL